jgi:hypothetical protein
MVSDLAGISPAYMFSPIRGVAPMTLTQQRKDKMAEDLPTRDGAIITGYMGSCVSVVILWGFDEGLAENMRGFHGAGGVEMVNFESLAAGLGGVTDLVVHGKKRCQEPFFTNNGT